MFGFIAQFLKGIILGWIASLVMMLVKRMVTKAFGADAIHAQEARAQAQAGAKSNPYKNNNANQNTSDIVETIWVGMSTAQLVKTFGPALTKQYSGTREIWTYLNLRGQGAKTAIAIQNGIVVNWQDIRATGPARFAAPSP